MIEENASAPTRLRTTDGLDDEPFGRPTRCPSWEERECIAEMYRRKKRYAPINGYVTTAAPVPMGNDPWGPNPERVIPPGTTLKVVMVSRMGDCGLTDIMDSDHGYGVRLEWADAAITDIRLCPEPRQSSNNPEEHSPTK